MTRTCEDADQRGAPLPGGIDTHQRQHDTRPERADRLDQIVDALVATRRPEKHDDALRHPRRALPRRRPIVSVRVPGVRIAHVGQERAAKAALQEAGGHGDRVRARTRCSRAMSTEAHWDWRGWLRPSGPTNRSGEEADLPVVDVEQQRPQAPWASEQAAPKLVGRGLEAIEQVASPSASSSRPGTRCATPGERPTLTLRCGIVPSRAGIQTSAPKRGPTTSTSYRGARSRASRSARPVALSDRSKARIETFTRPGGDEAHSKRLERRRDTSARVPRLDEPPPALAEPRRRAGSPTTRQCGGKGRGVAGGYQRRVLTVDQGLGHDADARGDQRTSRGQILEDHA